jgi:hypothetical protein
MGEGDALPLDDVHAQGGRVEQQVDDVVVEQVDFVDVQQATVGGGQDAGSSAATRLMAAMSNCHTILGRRDEQSTKRQHISVGLAAGARPSCTPVVSWPVAIRAASATTNFGEGKGAGRGQRAALAANQNPADARVDRIEHQGATHALLADDGGERVNHAHGVLRRHYTAPGRGPGRGLRAVRCQDSGLPL